MGIRHKQVNASSGHSAGPDWGLSGRGLVRLRNPLAESRADPAGKRNHHQNGDEAVKRECDGAAGDAAARAEKGASPLLYKGSRPEAALVGLSALATASIALLMLLGYMPAYAITADGR